MANHVRSLQALNRATLARQGLLKPKPAGGAAVQFLNPLEGDF